MRDSLSLILATILIVILLIILPLYNYFERQDDISYNIALKSVTTLVDEVAQNGYLDQAMYDDFIERLSTTGNSYEIEVEAKKKVLTPNPDGSSDYIEQYKSYYNKDIFDDDSGKTSTVISKDNSLKNDAFFLDEGDKFFVKVKNTNTTMASALLSAIVSSVPREKINISYGATIKNNNWQNASVSQLYQSDILVTIDLQNPNPTDENNGLSTYSIIDTPSDRILNFKVKVLNADDSDIASKITNNIRLIGTNPNCYISPDSISSGSDEGEYVIRFTLDESKANTYFSNNEYNTLQCFLPAGSIQGKFSKNASASSAKIIIKKSNQVEVPQL